ncbi:hypothetical protein [Sphingomonas sp. PAMC 26605]|uniref:hypothetical protein n=1 Tax=Sphingomonas sp. PAMC 26605 TaxID=1112214 RepID=UPI0012F4AAD3|nr:hypothetical protein [Sphingomonas sp. PAMC 26605]
MNDRKENDRKTWRSATFKDQRLVRIDRIIAVTIVIVSITVALFTIKDDTARNSKTYVTFLRPAMGQPIGCSKRIYSQWDKISRHCAVKETEIHDLEPIGLPASIPSKGRQWYRIGNDALEVQCTFIFKYCTVVTSIKNKFKQKP